MTIFLILAPYAAFATLMLVSSAAVSVFASAAICLMVIAYDALRGRSLKMLGAKGSIDWRTEPIHSYRDVWEIDDRVPQLAWLWQLNRGVFKSPGSKWESWTTSIVMSDADAERYVENFEEMAAAITQ